MGDAISCQFERQKTLCTFAKQGGKFCCSLLPLETLSGFLRRMRKRRETERDCVKGVKRREQANSLNR